MYYSVFNHLIACITKPAVNPNRIQNGATLTNDLLVRQTCNHFIMAQRDQHGGEGSGERRSKFRVRDCSESSADGWLDLIYATGR